MSVASSSIATDSRADLDDLPPYDWSTLPVEHCAYCGCHNKQAVVKCLGKDCNKWFCNGGMSNGSHLIMHLVKSRHKEIQLHPESPLKDAGLECHSCKTTNVFMLGFMPAKTEQYVILLCREPCLRQLS
jgi:regulator of nonsense transcripts 1